MSTVTEIEQAIERLTAPEREALETRLVAHRFGLDALDENEHAELERSLTQSREEVVRGEFFTGDALRSEMRKWLGK